MNVPYSWTKPRRFAIGLLYGTILSTFGSFFLLILGTMAAGFFSLDAWTWFFLCSVIPVSSCFAVLAVVIKKPLRTKSVWLLGILLSFLTVELASLVGIVLNIVKIGYERVNIEGYLVWGPIYAVFFSLFLLRYQ
ncbi:hypothetical protein ACI7RC_07835 [Brevibacillus sp. B_LB10_24]|uniref:hypothetical protein n=1 Tax=Brevibacillus sp. B_LB10_24 TaxID=3380645 RepID=UPI0038B9DDAE